MNLSLSISLLFTITITIAPRVYINPWLAFLLSGESHRHPRHNLCHDTPMSSTVSIDSIVSLLYGLMVFQILAIKIPQSSLLPELSI